ncbi:helix-turn-helix domain-containing protein [Peribacillus simplex]|uniref:helix-turn-helix domain-containing protein n=1 Tax=Peribacillus simplex TaxID=1478 RepID=UPI003D2AD9AD
MLHKSDKKLYTNYKITHIYRKVIQKMIRNRLAIVMAERNIKSISELHRMIQEKDMTISRRTLDKFYNNQNNNISYDTLETLCTILDCELHELLVLQK